MRARVSWLDIDEQPRGTRKISVSRITATKDLPPNDMADDNSRGRRLKSSLKNECERVHACVGTYTHTRTYVRAHHTHEAWLAESGGGRI